MITKYGAKKKWRSLLLSRKSFEVTVMSRLSQFYFPSEPLASSCMIRISKTFPKFCIIYIFDSGKSVMKAMFNLDRTKRTFVRKLG